MNDFTNPEIILGTDGLVHTEGFWSGKEVLICTSEKPTIHLLNKKTTTYDMIQAIESHIDVILHDMVVDEYLYSIASFEPYEKRKFTQKCVAKKVSPKFRFTKIPELKRPEFIGKQNRHGIPRWNDILATLHADGKTDKEIAEFLADTWIGYYRENTPLGLHFCNSNCFGQIPLLLIAWRQMDSSVKPEEFLQILWHLVALDTSTLRAFGEYKTYRDIAKKEGYAKLIADISDVEWQLLEKFKTMNFREHSSAKAKAFMTLPAGAAIGMAILLNQKYILVNSGAHSGRLPMACSTIGALDQYAHTHSTRYVFSPLICGSTVRKAEDVPVDLPDLLMPVTGKSYLGALKSYLMDYPTKENRLPPFDLSRFTRSKKRKTVDCTFGTPEWLHAKGHSEEWVEFFRLSLELSRKSEAGMRSDLKRLSDWAGKIFNSPWAIRPVDLRDPANPKNPNTYYAFLCKNNCISTNSVSWITTAALYRRAANHLNTPGYPGYQKAVKRVNPFKNIQNPFMGGSRKGVKTHRSRISTVLHDKLIEVLLSPDENGKPTFKWAQETSMKFFSSSDFLKNGVWCPSRWTALAVLLLLPPRKKQVRWMDQGLMDEYVFDPDTFKMIKNVHKLRDFCYEDGQSHLKRYGRPSGAIQPISDSFMGITEHLGIFINTNKTQLWDPKRRNGYELPWPDGDELLKSEDPEVQMQGRWLRQVYEVLALQYKSVQEHDPDPVPVTFSDVIDDRRGLPQDVDHQILPCFVPLFREFSTKETVKRKGMPIHASLPISTSKLKWGFKALCMEVENILKAEGFKNVQLTLPQDKNSLKNGSEGTLISRKLKFDIHSLRVAGISRLIEMDIDPTIVQEFVAGHLTPAMTHRYLKLQPWHVREKIIEALANGNLKSAMNTWAENIAKGKGNENVAQGFVSVPRFRGHIADLPDDYACIAPVGGGICVMGGMGDPCNEGGVYERQLYNKDETETMVGPVRGGCGNCRFFKTAPFLILEQSFYLDTIMDDLRAMACERKELRNKVTNLECQITSCTEKTIKYSLEDKKSLHKARLESLNHNMVPLVTEWVNRYMMLEDCQKMIDDNLDGQSGLALVSTFGSSVGLTIKDMKVEIEHTTELGLCGRIVEKARTLEGRGVAIPAKPAMMLQRAVDVILRSIDSPYLLLDIGEDQVGRATSMLYNMLEETFGPQAIDKAAKRVSQLPLDCSQKEQIKLLVSAVVSGSKKERLSISDVIFDVNNSVFQKGPAHEKDGPCKRFS